MLIVWYCRVAQSVLLDNSKLFHKYSIFAHTFSMYHGQGSFVCVCFYLEGGGGLRSISKKSTWHQIILRNLPFLSYTLPNGWPMTEWGMLWNS